jgi:hypothetical protein
MLRTTADEAARVSTESSYLLRAIHVASLVAQTKLTIVVSTPYKSSSLLINATRVFGTWKKKERKKKVL